MLTPPLRLLPLLGPLFGSRLLAISEKLGLRQLAVAEILGISLVDVQLLEMGMADLSNEDWQRAEAALREAAR